MNCEFKKAFTLAEVLITLAVIGVVAAMTIPNLVQNYKKQEVSAKLKKSYSMLQQAIKLSEIDNGSIEYWSKSPEVMTDEGKTDKVANADLSERFFTQYLAPYIKYTSIQKAKSATTNIEFVVYLIDGTLLLIHNGDTIDITIDINGDKKPNSYGYDRFKFLLGLSSDSATIYCQDGTKLSPIGVNTYKTREAALDACKKDPYYCVSLLFYDNWEFKDDYPYKL